MSNVDEPPESPSIDHAKPRPPSGIPSTLLATPVDHIFARARFFPPPPPTEKPSSGVAASPPEALAGPRTLESDNVRSLER